MTDNMFIHRGDLVARLTPMGEYPWPRPAVYDKRQVALVLGPAPCLCEDMLRFPGGIPSSHAITTFAVNRAVALVPARVDNVVTCHPDDLDDWTPAAFRGRLRELGVQVHSTLARPGVDFVWGFAPGCASSGQLAVFVALALGYSRVYLAGIPLENTGYLGDAGNATDYTQFHPLWEQTLPLMAGRVFSLSGPETFTGRLLPL